MCVIQKFGICIGVRNFPKRIQPQDCFAVEVKNQILKQLLPIFWYQLIIKEFSKGKLDGIF